MEQQTEIKEVKHRKPKKLPVFVSSEDLLAIMKIARHKHHKFAYMMAWYSGLRISELLNLEPRDIDMDKGTILVRQGKGSKDGVCMDIFMGSGTTALTSLELGRKFIGFEINPEYVKIAEARIKPYLEQNKLFVFQENNERENKDV